MTSLDGGGLGELGLYGEILCEFVLCEVVGVDGDAQLGVVEEVVGVGERREVEGVAGAVDGEGQGEGVGGQLQVLEGHVVREAPDEVVLHGGEGGVAVEREGLVLEAPLAAVVGQFEEERLGGFGG